MHPTRLSYRKSAPLPGRQFAPSTTQRSTPPPTPHRGPSLHTGRVQTVADRAVGTPVKPDVSPVPYVATGNFVWEKNWYAVLPENIVDPSTPYGFTLLGRELVLWRDAEKNWRVLGDRCSHRQARLSRGRFNKKGELMCGFHGWSFDGEGRCTRIPQAPQALEKKFCSSRRSSVASYPVQVKDGLIWVWGESSPKAWVESSMTEIASWEPVKDSMGEEEWGMSEMPMGYHTMMEMFFDLSHVPILHEGTVPGAGENSAVPFEMRVTKSGREGFSLVSSGHLKSTVDCATTIDFKAPGTCSAVFNKPNGDKSMVQAYYTPSTPGKCRVIVGLKTVKAKKEKAEVGVREHVHRFATQTQQFAEKIKQMDPSLIPDFLIKALALGVAALVTNFAKIVRKASVAVALEFLPESWRIALTHAVPRDTKVENQDLHVLLGMDQVLNGIENRWKRQYFSPLKTDVGVMAFRNWLDRFSNGDVKWAPGAKPFEAKTFEQVFDRWDRHTKHCKHCKKTAKDFIGLATWLRRVALGALVVSGWVLLRSDPFHSKLCIGALVVAGLSMLGAGKADAILTSLKSSIPHASLPGNVDLVYKESTG